MNTATHTQKLGELFFLKDHSDVDVAAVHTVHNHLNDYNWEVISSVLVPWVLI